MLLNSCPSNSVVYPLSRHVEYVNMSNNCLSTLSSHCSQLSLHLLLSCSHLSFILLLLLLLLPNKQLSSVKSSSTSQLPFASQLSLLVATLCNTSSWCCFVVNCLLSIASCLPFNCVNCCDSHGSSINDNQKIREDMIIVIGLVIGHYFATY